MPKVNSGLSDHVWLREREIGTKSFIGTGNSVFSKLYTSILSVSTWDHGQNLKNPVHGGVFNLEFSPDGTILVAACEKKAILMFDSLTGRKIHGIYDAHTECVNCVRFLDSRLFATCSDDTTIALWDARNLKQRIHTLRGHKNWVKNIEFSAKDDLLVTSGFDGSIYTWDINNYSEKRVFHTHGLMRMRLSPDASKMVISTTGGYLMVIHNLDLNHLEMDLRGFKPNMYRLEQQNEWAYPNGENYTHLFSRNRIRNRVEFITDFPGGIEAEVISSVQVHPQGWCALSRSICNEERAEWTCVHDIQDHDTSDMEDEDLDESPPTRSSSLLLGTYEPPPVSERPVRSPGPRSTMSRRAAHRSYPERHPVGSDGTENPRRMLRIGEIVRRGGTYTANVELHVSSSDVWEALVAVREARVSRQREREARALTEEGGGRFEILVNRNSLDLNQVMVTNRQIMADLRRQVGRTSPMPAGSSPPAQSSSVNNIRVVSNEAGVAVEHRFPHSIPGTSQRTVPYRSLSSVINPPTSRRPQAKLHQNVPRLLNFIEEPNVGKGFIKELCFSSDGRLICSPFSFGVRLLAFSPKCAELSTVTPSVNAPVKLYEVGSNICHSNTVVSTQWSPRHCLLVSGCLNGKIVWYQPMII